MKAQRLATLSSRRMRMAERAQAKGESSFAPGSKHAASGQMSAIGQSFGDGDSAAGLHDMRSGSISSPAGGAPTSTRLRINCRQYYCSRSMHS
jgi:hypothetical protein